MFQACNVLAYATLDDVQVTLRNFKQHKNCSLVAIYPSEVSFGKSNFMVSFIYLFMHLFIYLKTVHAKEPELHIFKSSFLLVILHGVGTVIRFKIQF